MLRREFKIQCKGIGVHPPLELSHQVVHLAATALYDVAMTTVYVNNSHTDMNEFSHPVPRIGQGRKRAHVVLTLRTIVNCHHFFFISRRIQVS